jgi:hypothetical protein
VNTIEGREGRIRRSEYRIPIGNVTYNASDRAARLAAERAQAGGGSRQHWSLDVGHHYLSAGRNQGAADTQPDAARGTGNKCNST